MATPAATGLTVADIEALPEDVVIRHLIDGELRSDAAVLDGLAVPSTTS